MHKRWLPFEHAVMGSLIRTAAAARRPLRLVLGMDDGLFSNTRLNLAATLWYHRYRPSFVSYLMTFPDGDNVESYRRQLTDKRATALITGEQRPGQAISQPKVEEAARLLSFARLRSFRMPDGRTIWIWWRS